MFSHVDLCCAESVFVVSVKVKMSPQLECPLYPNARTDFESRAFCHDANERSRTVWFYSKHIFYTLNHSAVYRVTDPHPLFNVIDI